MSSSNALYAATCNPPRRAKRPRTDSPSLPTQNVRIRPNPSPPSAALAPISVDSLLAAEKLADQRPPSTSMSETTMPTAAPDHTQLPPPKKRGRKPNSGNGGLSRSARESQRKINHSRIEKARRSKINDALDALRILVPNSFAAVESHPQSHGKKDDKDKEFKLDILERTVIFVRHLLDKVHTLENQPYLPSSSKITTETLDLDQQQKQELEGSEDEIMIGEDEHDDEEDMECDQSTSLPLHLPSISSWLGEMSPETLETRTQHKEPILPPLAPSSFHHQPQSDTRGRRQSIVSFDAGPGKTPYDSRLGLLSPPGSGRINAQPGAASAVNFAGSLPSLRLPSPRAGLASLLNEPMSIPVPVPTSKWTPEDENVASLLLQISSSASSSSVSPASSLSPLTARREYSKVAPSMQKKVQTPGAMLGIDVASTRRCSR